MANTLIVDSLKLVRDRQRLTGSLAVASLPRLVQSLHGSEGNLDYAITGDSDARDRPLLRLRVSGAVQMQCQRCLEAMVQELRVDSVVRLVAAEALDSEYEAIGANPDEPDCIVASKTMDIAVLVEDEVLLALPPFPRHEAAVCKGKVDGAAQTGEMVNPFKALQGLKNKYE